MTGADVARPRVLLVYASTHGHTAKIAARVAEALRGARTEVDVRDIGQVGDASPGDYDGSILAASLHGHRHQREMVEWAKHHHLAFDGRPSAFLSVSLTAAEDTDEARAATQDCIDDFLDDTGWTPTRTLAIAGALEYREYDVFTRVVIRLMMARAGHETDISHDHVYTDWEALDRFAAEFARLLTSREADDGRG